MTLSNIKYETLNKKIHLKRKTNLRKQWNELTTSS